uniref:Uncharacterized protein n=1 Tax=Picea glauca TaxID=3330 RepID=A0A101LV32_PICGL|nr:hypothetical protein ABT39_MTgene2524 [Picea glauca]
MKTAEQPACTTHLHTDTTRPQHRRYCPHQPQELYTLELQLALEHCVY